MEQPLEFVNGYEFNLAISYVDGQFGSYSVDYLSLDKMAALSQTTSSNAFSWM